MDSSIKISTDIYQAWVKWPHLEIRYKMEKYLQEVIKDV